MRVIHVLFHEVYASSLSLTVCGQKSGVENGDWGGKGLLTEARPPAKVIFPPPTPLAEKKAGSFSTFNAYVQCFTYTTALSILVDFSGSRKPS